MTIENEDGDVVYTEDLPYGTVQVDSIAENIPFNGDGFKPDAEGVYTGTYTVALIPQTSTTTTTRLPSIFW